MAIGIMNIFSHKWHYEFIDTEYLKFLELPLIVTELSITIIEG